ncbi:MAG: Ig-like domain-containing protein [Holophagales bacterium]|jgi:uncharacterized protein YjdB|nr:Ig-like domain-containing protein [Holophagales bacterium]
MKKQLLLLLSAVIALTLAFSACGGDDGVKSVPASGVSLSETSLTLQVGLTKTLTATVQPENAASKAVDWLSSDTIVASVNASGVVTALKAGTATISVSTREGNHTARCALTVPAVSVTGVSLDKTAIELFVGGMYTLLETIAPANATDKAVSWSSDNPAIVNVSNDGVVIAFAPGRATVSLRTRDGGYTASCAVSVSSVPIVPVTAISLNKTELSLAVGASDILIATVSPGHATNMAVSWHSSNTDAITVSDDGAVRAIAEGEATVTVASVSNPDIKRECFITAKPFFDPGVTVYVAGNYGGPTIWVNGEAQRLDSQWGGGVSVASVAVARDGSVYAAGSTDNTWPPTPLLWKDRQPQTLNSPNGGRAFSVFVAENGLASDGVYVAGHEGTSGAAARVWKDGQILYSLPSNTVNAHANSVYVSGGDIYAVGFDLNNNWMVVATAWKNGQLLYQLTNGIQYGGNAYSVVAHNGIVYIAGADPLPNSPLIIPRATIWKDGAPTHLTDGSFEAEANSVFVTDEGDVYVAGYESNVNSISVATVWKNGELLYRLTDGQYGAQAESVFVIDGEVYVAGYDSVDTNEGDEEGNFIAVMWRNGLRLTLNDGSTTSARATSVFVRRND